MTGNYEKFSVEVIIPVKNGEKYIRDSINSVLAQTHKNIRVTVVDDGSTDETAKICDEYAEKYANVRVFHICGGGVSVARNYGIEHAEGDYIAFLDADDYAVSYCYETLLRNALENDCEISACDHYRVNNRNFFETVQIPGKVIKFNDKKSSLENMLQSDESFGGYAWNKIYKHSVISGIRFQNYVFCEDCIFSWDVVSKAKNICYTTEKLIYYFVSYKIYPPTIDGIKVYREMLYRAKEEKLRNVEDFLLCGYVYHIAWAARNLVLSKTKNESDISKQFIRKLLSEVKYKKLHLTKALKLRIFLINHNWVLYKFFEKIIYTIKKK